jgi:hypothetical protein
MSSAANIPIKYALLAQNKVSNVLPANPWSFFLRKLTKIVKE